MRESRFFRTDDGTPGHFAAAITAVLVAVCAAEVAAIAIVAVTRPPAEAPTGPGAGAPPLPPAAGTALPDGAGPELAAMIIGDALPAPCRADDRNRADC